VFVLLLPPSEGKATGGGAPLWRPELGRFGPDLADARRAVVDALDAVDGGTTTMLGARGPTLERAQHANRSLVGAPTLPAHQRFTGVVWEHLGFDSLRPTARTRALANVLVINGLTGACALDDPLPDFRLKANASLGEFGGVARHWREHLSPVLDDALDGHLVIDLLPAEHRGAWVADESRYDLRRVHIVDDDGRPIGHAAKAAKGRLARELLTVWSAKTVLDRWRHDGFRAEVR